MARIPVESLLAKLEANFEGRNAPPQQDERYGQQHLSGADSLREDLSRRHLKPTPAFLALGPYNGPVSLPEPPRLGDANVGQEAVGHLRAAREQREAEQQQQER